MALSEFDLINELSAEIADVTLSESIDEECEVLLDALYAEHEAMTYAAHSFDLDAEFYATEAA